MNKITIILLLTYLVYSCSDINNTEKPIAKIENLKKENDSLKKIIADINTKYIFDSISIRDIPDYKNKYELNSKINGEIVFVGYSVNQKTNVILIDSITYNPKNLYNPDTLKMINGGFNYEVELNADRISLNGIMEIQNDYGKEYYGTFRKLIGVE
jgi:hypothetical protein